MSSEAKLWVTAMGVVALWGSILALSAQGTTAEEGVAGWKSLLVDRLGYGAHDGFLGELFRIEPQAPP